MVIIIRNNNNNNNNNIKWYIKEKPKAYSSVIKKCMLCLSKKFHNFFSKERLLNRRNKIISKCRHENKHKLDEGTFYKKFNLMEANVIPKPTS